ncbi:MAG: hypothetical protein H7A24_16995 [Leptospiraceae bacterium]|nr:hypothetical protein [Leptospiraceae bacterium]MCP5513589.1 hypothetical protein [Leptospiraceae bacterium]
MDIKSIKKVSIFDFDGTLVRTPLPHEGKEIYFKKTGKPWPYLSWWSKKESLDLSIFDIPKIEKVIRDYHTEIQNPDTFTIMMTGRLESLSSFIEIILEHHNLSFHRKIYNPGTKTFDYKIKSILMLNREFPGLEEIEIWDDRDEHIPGFRNLESKLNNLKSYKVNHILP